MIKPTHGQLELLIILKLFTSHANLNDYHFFVYVSGSSKMGTLLPALEMENIAFLVSGLLQPTKAACVDNVRACSTYVIYSTSLCTLAGI